MVRRNGFSPQKEVRRSNRERSFVYRSLEEQSISNSILNNSDLLKDLLGKANDEIVKDRRLRSTIRSGYTRSGRRIVHSSDEDEDEPPTRTPSDNENSDEEDEQPIRRRSRRLSHADDHEEGSEPRKPSPKRKRVVIEDDDPNGSGRSSRTETTKNGTVDTNHDISLVDRIKLRRLDNGNGTRSASPKVNGSANGSHPTVSARSLRFERRVKHSNEDDDKHDDEDEESDEEEEQGPRTYSLRERRAPVDRFAFEKKETRKSSRFRDTRDNGRSRESRRYACDRSSKRAGEHRRRMVRSDSSSTESEEDRVGRRSSKNDDDKFERRKERSMAKARNRFLPINLSSKDLSTSQSVVRERLRQTGASCSDIDPMGLEADIGFDQVGGLGAHIQSLKEVVMFPLLYPDVFKQFNINPPKGVVFYGPPGTGKTLVARALARECSKGARKVAFFMRKGADCLSKWVGESERQLRLLFDQAYAMRPSIIFFDEIDGLAPVRSSRQDQIHASIVSTLLALMDGLDNRGEVVVIGATNRLDTLDPALRRPGRFDRELKFSLPDIAARRQILGIHTEKWGESKPADEVLDWLSENTSGYCGADLKYLCTESVLIALRARYPHIYMTSDRLALDPTEIKITRENFSNAMRLITPASRRDLSIPSRPLDERTSILLSNTLSALLSLRIPAGYRSSQSIQSLAQANELEKVVRALEPPPCVPAVRLLLCGSETAPDAGQTAYILPALLSRLDHLPVYSIAVSRLFADGRPEEALAQCVQSALRSAANGPCILLLPSIDQWFSIVPASIAHMLETALDSLTGSTSILFLATCDTSYESAPSEITQLFRPANCIRLTAIRRSKRLEYFKFILKAAFIPPMVFDASKYIDPGLASEQQPDEVRKLNEKEAAELEKVYQSLLLHFRNFLRDKLGRLMRDRRFLMFNMPVDKEDAADYYEVITNPLCLTEMMDKIDRREYNHPDQFLADISLIMANALEYNPNVSLDDKLIRHQAIGLRDMAEAIFDAELDEDFVERLEETSRLLSEAGVAPKNAKTIPLPKGFVRKTKWSVANGYMEDAAASTSVKPTDARQDSTRTTATQPIRNTPMMSGVFKKKRKSKSYKLPSSSQRKKRTRTAAIVKSIALSLNQTADSDILDQKDTEKDTEEEGDEDEDEEMEQEAEKSKTEERSNIKSRTNTPRSSPIKEKTIKSEEAAADTKELILDEEAMNVFTHKCVEVTNGWTVVELEKLASVFAHAIETYRNKWNRRRLITELDSLLDSWDFESGNTQKTLPTDLTDVASDDDL